MQQFPYWQKQDGHKSLFPDIEWSKPEQQSHAGKLGLVGGNKLGFVAVGDAYAIAQETGAGQVRVLLPDALQKTALSTISDVVFASSNPSGGLSRDAQPALDSLGEWADGILLIGDAGGNSETAILYENFINKYQGPLTVTRDAVDLLLNSAEMIVARQNSMLIVSFAQLQKICRQLYYPKMLLFRMQLQQVVETLHKFTVTYPSTIVTFHQDNLIIAKDGRVITTAWDNPMDIWKGRVAARIATFWLWNPSKPLESAASSLVE